MAKEKHIRLLIVFFLSALISTLVTSCYNNSHHIKKQEKDIALFINSYNRFNSSEEKKQSADSIGKLLQNLPNSKNTRNLLSEYIQATNDNRSYIDLLFKFARKDHDLVSEAKAYTLLGNLFDKEFQSDSAFYNYTKAEYLYKNLNDSIALQDIYTFKAIILARNGIYSEAQTNILNSMSINKQQKTLKVRFAENALMAETLIGLSQNEEAIRILELTLALLNDPKISEFYNEDVKRLNIASVNATIAQAYINLEDYFQAKQIVNDIIEHQLFIERSYDALIYSHLLYMLSDIDLKTNNLNGVDKRLKIALKLLKEQQNTQTFNETKLLLGEYYFKKGDDYLASIEVNDVLNYSRIKQDLKLEKDALSVFLKYENGNFQGSYKENFIRYEEIGNLILDENTIVKNTFARISFEADNLLRVNKKLEEQKNKITIFGGILFFGAIIGFLIILMKQKLKEIKMGKLLQLDTEKYYDSILNTLQELTEARNIERKGIAQELHDGVLNKLFVTRFLLMQLNKDTIENQKDVLINELQDVEKYIRNVSHALANEEAFKTGDFEQLIYDLIHVQNRNKNTHFVLHIDEDINLQLLDSKYKVHIYRIIQEALQNVQKYANAKNCIVTFKFIKKGLFKVIIKDDGIGFDPSDIKFGLGFSNIKQRSQMMNSKFYLFSKPNFGTKISFFIKYED